MKTKLLLMTLLLPLVTSLAACSKTCKITVVNMNEDMGEVVGTGKYKAHETIIISATPFDGYEFINWTNEAGKRISSKENYKLEVETSMTIYAKFDYKDYGVKVESQFGYISGSGNHKYLSTVTLKSTPICGFKFVRWEDGDGNTVSNDNPYSFTMPKETLSFKAIYEQRLMEYGRYPRTVVSDTTLISELEKITETNEKGYIEYEGNEYKKSVASILGAAEPYVGTFSDGSYKIKNHTYYFKVEPISWKVVDENEDSYLLFANESIDYLTYNSKKFEQYGDQLSYFQESYYMYSDIRDYLTGPFLSLAFTEDELANIKTTRLSDPMAGCTNFEYVHQFEIDDKVFIPSKQEYETYFKFSTSSTWSPLDWNYCLSPSDYAFSKGYPEAYNGRNFADWVMTRTPYYYDTSLIYDRIYRMAPGTVADGHVTYNYHFAPMMWVSK